MVATNTLERAPASVRLPSLGHTPAGCNPIEYVSTRGKSPPVNLGEAMLQGLAPEGGLYIPSQLPTLSQEDMRYFAQASYQNVALRVLAPFAKSCIDYDVLRELIREAYKGFPSDDVVSFKGLGNGSGNEEHLIEPANGKQRDNPSTK